jgi:hypothetical protein
MESASGPVRAYLDRFVAETIGELFPTPEACAEFYARDENFARLMNGEIGDNLMHKYRAVASFQIWPDICAAAMDTMKRLLVAHGVDRDIVDFEVFWENFHRYVACKHAHGHTVEEILAPHSAVLTYDIDRWIADGMSADPSPYRLPEPTEFRFRLGDEARQGLAAALQVWTASLKGLAKMVTRIKVAWQVRECERVSALAAADRSAPAAFSDARFGDVAIEGTR